MEKNQKRSQKRISVLYPLENTLNQSEVKSEGRKLKVAAYCRVSSSSEEQLSSYNAQVKYFKKYITENPDYDFIGVYADEGISGTDIKKRVEFKRLMSDAREKKIDMIITKSLSRFGRNTLDCLKSIRELKDLGVDVFFEKENIHTKSSEGEMLITLLLATAQSESQNLSSNIKWGIHKRYERGDIKCIPSGKFFGYDKDEYGNLIINEEQAIIVKRIYEEFLGGFGYYQIAKRLTDEGVTTETGNKIWNWSTLKKILTNEKYKGDTLFQKTFNADYLTKKRVKNTGQLPRYYSENTHPNIIDRDIWECVQLEFERQEKIIKEHKMNKYHQHSERLPFSGKMFCSNCGQTFVRREARGGENKGTYYWRCRERKKPKEDAVICTNTIRIKDELPEQIFIKSWNQLVEDNEWKNNVQPKSALKKYKVRELIRLTNEIGKIDKSTYELILKTLDYINVDNEGKIEIIFLAGIKVKV